MTARRWGRPGPPVLLAAAAGALTTTGCERPPSHDECHRLLDRATRHLAQQANPTISDERLARLALQARALASRDERFAYCSTRVSRGAYDCAMAAPDLDAFERCLP